MNMQCSACHELLYIVKFSVRALSASGDRWCMHCYSVQQKGASEGGPPEGSRRERKKQKKKQRVTVQQQDQLQEPSSELEQHMAQLQAQLQAQQQRQQQRQQQMEQMAQQMAQQQAQQQISNFTSVTSVGSVSALTNTVQPAQCAALPGAPPLPLPNMLVPLAQWQRLQRLQAGSQAARQPASLVNLPSAVGILSHPGQVDSRNTWDAEQQALVSASMITNALVEARHAPLLIQPLAPSPLPSPSSNTGQQQAIPMLLGQIADGLRVLQPQSRPPLFQPMLPARQHAAALFQPLSYCGFKRPWSIAEQTADATAPLAGMLMLCCSSITTHYLLVTDYCLLLTTYYLLLTTYCFGVIDFNEWATYHSLLTTDY